MNFSRIKWKTALALVIMSATPLVRGGELTAKLIDQGVSVFADRYPDAALLEQPIPTPRGERIGFLAVARLESGGAVQFHFKSPPKHLDGTEFNGKLNCRELIPVHVEGNHQGSKNYPGGAPPPAWRPFLTRQAPFDLLEAIDNEIHESLTLPPGATGGVFVEIAIPKDAKPGLYYGEMLATAGAENRSLVYSFEVFPIEIPGSAKIDSMHWLWIEPENLTTGKAPSYWSEEHWNLLENSGRIMLSSGDNVLFTPTIFGKVPLIPAVKTPAGYEFDFTRFRRWLNTFSKLGFRGFVGHHLHSWMLPLNVRDSESGQSRTVELADPERMRVLEAFLPALNAELRENGYLKRYRQHLMDEPKEKEIELYRQYEALFRRAMPECQNIDALFRREVVPMADVAVMHIQHLRFSQPLNQARRKTGKEFWIYSSCDPRPPFPNRQLDHFPTGNRLYPLLAIQYDCTGYLNWAANIYRGANEYKSSLGPYPNGSQNPGHPPGDAWFFYRGPDGLRTGIRMMNFRSGIVDAALLRMLRQRAPERSAELLQTVYHPEWELPDKLGIWADRFAEYTGRAFSTDPGAYHQLRRNALRSLTATSRERKP
jgi:hypothetical protein